MKTILSILLILAYNFSANALTIITDLDDTLKFTQVHNKILAAKNGLFTSYSILGMPEMLNVFKNQQNEKFNLIVVSASPKFLDKTITSFLEVHKIPYNDLILLGSSSKKYMVIKDLIHKIQDNEIILLGDDQNDDEAILSTLKAEIPEKVQKVYIRKTNPKEISATGDINYFFSPLEIIVSEYKEGRLSLENLNLLSQNLVNLTNQPQNYKNRQKVIINTNFCHAKTLENFRSETAKIIRSSDIDLAYEGLRKIILNACAKLELQIKNLDAAPN